MPITKKINYIHFIKKMFIHTLTSFGGGNAQYGLILKNFVHSTDPDTNQPYLSEKELTDFTNFSYIIPGGTPSQALLILGYKKGGIKLSLLSLLIWILPGSIAMGFLSFVITNYLGNPRSTLSNLLSYFPAMGAGYFLFAVFQVFKKNVIKINEWIIFIFSSIFAFFAYANKFYLFLILILSAFISYFLNKKKELIQLNKQKTHRHQQKIQWKYLIGLVCVFIISLTITKLYKIKNTSHTSSAISTTADLFNNQYYIGTINYGGSDATINMMYQFYTNHTKQKDKQNYLINNSQSISQADFLNGYSLVKALPGSSYSINSYIGSMIMKRFSTGYRILGAIIANIGFYIPSCLLLMFLFPLWTDLKHNKKFFIAAKGIYAAIAAIIFIDALKLISSIISQQSQQGGLECSYMNIIVILATFSLLQFTKIRSHYWVLFILLLGWISPLII